MDTWKLVGTYRMSDPESQMLVAALLNGMNGIDVRLRGAHDRCYLDVECTTAVQAISVERFIKSIDPRSVLAHTTNGVAEPLIA